jgi:hypothetical protein
MNQRETHVDELGSHAAPGAHSSEATQPTQRPVRRSHLGRSSGHWALPTHAAQRPMSTSQRAPAALPAQFALV